MYTELDENIPKHDKKIYGFCIRDNNQFRFSNVFFFFFLELNIKPNVTNKPGPALNDEESKRFTNPTAGEAVECCQSLT